MESREAIMLQNQVMELRRDMNALQQQRGGAGGSALGGYQAAPPPGGAPPSSDITTQLLDRVTQLEDEVRRLRGRLDEAENARVRQGEDLSKQIADLKFQMENGGKLPPAGAGAPAAAPAAGPAAAAPPPKPAAPDGATATPRRTPELALQEGNAALARRDYVAAEAAAREVLGNTKGPRATDAQFLLAQSLAGRKDWQGAAIAYDDAYNRSRAGSHAQDSLLGLASALVAINEKKAACQTLDKLHAEFPKPRDEMREPIANVRAKAGCH
jgi:TolA-binding protein